MKKRLFLICLLAVVSMSLFAQKKAAVLEFDAGTGVSQQDVEGLSNIFTTYFSPEGYNLVERNQIDKVIDELGFQKGRLTERDYLRLGRTLNLTAMVLGNINLIMGEYNVDVRLVAVSDGKILAKAGAAFQGSSYRTNMQSLATELSAKLVEVSGQLKTPEPEFVDLGLPSGTLWAKENIKENGETFFIGYDYKTTGGTAVPSYSNWRELFEMCKWTWDENNHEFIITGKNGNSIRLPAIGNSSGGYIGQRLYYATRESAYDEHYNTTSCIAIVYKDYSTNNWAMDSSCGRGAKGNIRLVK